MNEEDIVLSNLRDSVSRIVDNLKFNYIDEAAHAKLVGLMADKLFLMSHTCRALLENTGRIGSALNASVDIKHLFRIHRVDLRQLVDYTQQVRPFPPNKCDNHGEYVAEKEVDKTAENEKNTVEIEEIAVKPPQPTPRVFSFPVFDDMSDWELGFGHHSDTDSAMSEPPTPRPLSSSARLLEPPPPPPPIPPLFFYSPEFPDFESKYRPEPIEKQLKIFKADPPLYSPAKVAKDTWKYEKYEKYERNRAKTSQKLEKTPSNSSLAPKMTKKRLMQTNYERRLRNEQMAEEERKREKKREKTERKSMKIEKKEAIQQKQKFKERVIRNKREHVAPNRVPNIDENDNKLKSSEITPPPTKKMKTEEAPPTQPPLIKMLISFKRERQGFRIKKVETTIYNEVVNGEWKPLLQTWKSSIGIYSEPKYPIRPPKRAISEDDGKPKIPKLKLIKNADNNYSKVS
ncbi:hypothetical protein GCK72_003867 [Caenorhabditis remanei]|uniref:Bromodomain associated domain-containing protein n=1 Tax=Caenorhabditis remanei TaxID=31234 RepID=A0A6A5HAN1_CAERE|nr:hypothetical protein GCK72_003867 [Caenorhabditis remanei]KAF1763921.1 hypothetical protein GCK72_003867 [Caenorhabditis remanei]